MRFKSNKVDGYRVFAVCGTNTVSFAIDFDDAEIDGLLGFAVERVDPVEDERYYMYGFKVFPSLIPQVDRTTTVRTSDHPIQSFIWDDFTAKEGRQYEYVFHPLKGKPKKLVPAGRPISIKVKTEALFSGAEHDVFFNRGVASSQAYVREFNNQRPDQLEDPEERQRALDWLSRQLDEAILAFIAGAKKGDTLLGCFYEFRYAPVASALRAAQQRGVNLRLIVDGKVNEHTDDEGFHESFPREDNLRALKAAKLPKSSYVLREAKPSSIAHNKFMVLLKGKQQRPAEVWTGSTNLSDGGIHGQTNVGHWLRNSTAAAAFRDYWELLEADPGPPAGSDRATSVRLNKELRASVEALGEVPSSLSDIAPGVTTVFSPRSGSGVLEMYAAMIDEATDVACITLAFGIGAPFKKLLADNTKNSHVTFMLLEKRDKPNKRSKTPFVGLSAKNNVYQAWGSYLKDPLYQWERETNAARLKLNSHVSYVHSKFLLKDPLSMDPVVVTGSANFSDASTKENDENMLLIRGDRRVADIYFTEFNRLFYHYYFRSVQEATRQQPDRQDHEGTLFLAENDDWTSGYAPGKLKRKRLEILKAMKGFTKL
jgi:phosphatidylserine/phosphatidylglycerophosphate/cardiolipin synthase-like enzyme